MSDLCREVFEKHQAKLLNMDYQELKDQFDRHEQCFRKRYAAFSDFEKEFELWQAAWDVRQVEINQHQLEVHALGQANLNQAMMLAKKQEEIDSLKAQLKKWKGQSLAAMLHGACQCGEPWESVVSDKEGFNQLHCFNCNHDRYENKEYFGDHEPKALRGEHE